MTMYVTFDIIGSDPEEEYEREVLMEKGVEIPLIRNKEFRSQALIDISLVKQVYKRLTYFNHMKEEVIQIQFKDDSYSPVLLTKLKYFTKVFKFYTHNKKVDPGAIRKLEFKSILEISEVISKESYDKDTDSEEKGFIEE